MECVDAKVIPTCPSTAKGQLWCGGVDHSRVLQQLTVVGMATLNSP